MDTLIVVLKVMNIALWGAVIALSALKVVLDNE